MPNCPHLPLTDTGIGYYHCPACKGYWNEEEWEAMEAAKSAKDESLDDVLKKGIETMKSTIGLLQNHPGSPLNKTLNSAK